MAQTSCPQKVELSACDQSTMPSYKLTYFNVRALAEPIRYIFAAAGVEYEDCRVDHDGDREEFQKLKASGILPFGQVPILEVDGKVLSQSMAILKYVARETGLAPTDSFEVAKADAIVDGVVDVWRKSSTFFFEKDEETKETLTKDFYENFFPVQLGYFEKLLQSNDGKHFAGNKMTYADILFFATASEFLGKIEEDIPPALNAFPLLKDLFSRVKANPGIKEWISKRPVQ